MAKEATSATKGFGRSGASGSTDTLAAPARRGAAVAADRRIHEELRATRVREENPEHWEDTPDGKRHLKDEKLSHPHNQRAGSVLEVREDDPPERTWHKFDLRRCSTYKYDGTKFVLDGTLRVVEDQEDKKDKKGKK